MESGKAKLAPMKVL